jgi:hypothetical protein
VFYFVQALVRVAEPVPGLSVCVTRQVVFPTGFAMGGRNRGIEIEPVAMLETDIALVNELYIGPTTKNQKSSSKSERLGFS